MGNFFSLGFFPRAIGSATLAGALALLCGGCFDHRGAPERLVSARGMDEAAPIAATVEELDLSGGAGELPAEISSMPRLRNLYLRGGAYTGFAALAGIESLEVLDLARVRLGAMPPEVLSLKSLRDLYLSGCGLAAFPEGLESLPSLRYLNLDRNGIAELPDALPPGLRFLRLNFNEISSLPPSIGSLHGLRRLYLRRNRLETLPGELSACTELTDLDLAENNLAEFPSMLSALPRLRNLDLSGNARITSMPDGATLAAFRALRTLRLTGCPLKNEERARVRAALDPACAIIF